MEKTIFMGQLDIARAPDLLRTTLGSCVGVVLFDARSKTYGLAHIVLPSSANHTVDNVGKFADTAIPELVTRMGVPVSMLTAKIMGGANMFAGGQQKQVMNIGNQNIQAVREKLGALGIKVVAEDLGGDKGRQVLIDPKAEKVWVSCLGQEKKAI